MGTKIKNINIKGLRGVKETLTLPLEGKSILIYGDNGSGKSSISDSMEWFFMDQVRHLSGSEIDLKEALRNSLIPDSENSTVNITFSRNAVNSERTLGIKKNKLIAEYSNNTEDFKKYLDTTSSENLLLRYQFLTEFIDKAKGDKLKSLSDVIGFSEVNKTKEVLKKSFNSIKSEIKNQNFENQINTQKEILKEKIGAVVSVEKNLFEKINEIIKPLKLDIEITSIADIDALLTKLKGAVVNPLVTETKFLENCKNVLTTLKNESGYIKSEYEKYFSEFNVMASDVESIMQIFLGEILKGGKAVIEKKYHKDDSCPLCLQPKKKEDLLAEIQKRLKDIEDSSKKKASFDLAKQTIIKIADDRAKKIDVLYTEALINDPAHSKIKTTITGISNKIKAYQLAGNEKVTSGIKIKQSNDLALTDEDFNILPKIVDRIAEIKKLLEKDNTTTTYSNVSAAKDAFARIKKFEAEKAKLDKQKDSLQIIYEEFVKKQKDALENFINTFSETINEYYQFMNPGEQFEEIKIVTMGDDDELTGITIEYKYNNSWVSPPQKYFSESHLNCFGIAFFLASVKAFNNENKFLLLDDVISSFDANHRKRFADLLLDKFSDYQIILLTHESNWFEYVRSAVKNKNWLVNSVKWTEAKGTHFDETPENLKGKIELKIADNNTDKLGNEIREYLESILKDISKNLEVKLKFQSNDRNEDRMAFELLTELKGRVSKSTAFASHNALFDRAIASTFIGNKDSHDSKYVPSIGDLKAFWKDVQDIENLFYCNSCNTPVHLKYYDEAAKNIKCKCGAKIYDLKK